jgi:hypothetical protein
LTTGRLTIAIAAALTLAGATFAATPAIASFHLMKIREVGQGGPGSTDYVELC